MTIGRKKSERDFNIIDRIHVTKRPRSGVTSVEFGKRRQIYYFLIQGGVRSELNDAQLTQEQKLFILG